MKLIAGLGNPGRQYEGTRHNVGFRVIDELARRWQLAVTRHSFSGLVGKGDISGEPVLLLKPQTFMNLSGRSVREAMTFHKLAPADLLVVTDDLALPLAKVRVRARGSAGGHNGLTNIIAELGSEDFARVRLGIEWVSGGKMVRHVLGTFSEDEEPQIVRCVERAADAAEIWLKQGVEAAMNRFNAPEPNA
jgi:peptidyl-tRNA hydrolase, PTH1 family